MKQSWTALFLTLCMVMVGCGTTTGAANINGNWSATLTDTGGGATELNFATGLVINGGGTISATNFAFSTSGTCFAGQTTTESGSFTLSGTFNGNVTGSFQFQVQSTGSLNSLLTLNGTVNNGVITGTWTLTGGTGCTGNGNFTMTRM